LVGLTTTGLAASGIWLHEPFGDVALSSTVAALTLVQVMTGAELERVIVK
jgi:hypothetical protein